MPKIKFVEFRCPECEGNTLEEVSQGLIYNQIRGFYDRYPEYDDREVDETEVIRFQCYDCGENLIEGYSLDVFQVCKENGWLVLEAEAEASPDWEV